VTDEEYDGHGEPQRFTTPLWEAAAGGRTEIVEELLRAGAEVNVECVEYDQSDEDNEAYESTTSLHQAKRRGHTEIVQLLREHGATD